MPQYRKWRYISVSFFFVCIAINDGFAMIADGSGTMKGYQTCLYALFLLLIYFLILYVEFFFLSPRYLLRKKYAQFFILSSIWVFLMGLVQHKVDKLTVSYFDIPAQTIEGINPVILESLNIAGLFIIQMTVCVAIFTPMFLKRWMTEKQELNQIENKQVITQLNQLKELLNPEFLFTTLHRISSLEKTNSEKASDMVVKLSQLLRYQLYECKREEVFLSSEIRFITNYLELEKLYHTDFNYELLSPALSKPVLVPPLLFVTLIQEILKQNEQTCIIHLLTIKFLCNENQLIFICSADTSGNLREKDYSSFRKRLSLLYQDKYLLEVRDSDKTVHLEIEI